MRDKPIQVTFRDFPVSEAVEAACVDEAIKLQRYYDKITTCHVIVAGSHRRHRKGNLFEITIHLHVPGDDLVISRTPSEHRASEDIYVVVRESFDRARRVLEDYVRRRRGQVKGRGSEELRT